MMTSKQDLAPERAVDRGTKSSLIGILVNLGLALTKCIAGLTGHSFALVADGLESAADVISGVVVLFGLKLSVKPRTQTILMDTEKRSQSRQKLSAGLFWVPQEPSSTRACIRFVHPIRYRNLTRLWSLRVPSL